LSEEELRHLLERLCQRRLFDEVFVLFLEREPQGDWKLLEYGMKEIGEVAAWIAVQKKKHEKEQGA
jgi:hypothetical protein